MNLNEFHSFIPGTRANPREMNENFNFVLEEISTKANSDLSNLSKNGQDYIKNSSISKNIGELVYSCIPQTDSSLHLLDGSIVRNNGIYQNFVSYIANLSQNYPDLFTSETAWQQSVTDYGVCGKFVYDSTNNTVRLPKITGIIEGTVDASALGDLVEAGLPVHTHTRGTMNITGYYASRGIENYETIASGAFYNAGSTNLRAAGDSATGGSIGFDASRNWTGSTSNPDYTDNIQNSSTVQPQTIKCFIYIVIANSAKTEIQVDIDEVATDLNGKADRDLANLSTTGQAIIDNKAGVDLTNVNDSGYIKMAGASMPSDKYINLTLGASGSTYTAPADGWIGFVGTTSGRGSVYLKNISADIITSEAYDGGVFYPTLYMPVKKNDTFTIYTNNCSVTSDVFKFIYAQGSESEAS